MPREFLDQVVRLNVAEFHNEFDSIRRQFNAVAAVDALAAHIFYACQGDLAKGKDADTKYRERLAEENSDFRLLRDIAKANKHGQLKWGKPMVQKASDISSRPIGFGMGAYGAGRYGGPPQVVADVGTNDFRYVESVVDKALAFLETKMQALGL